MEQVKYFIEVTKFKCLDCGNTGYDRTQLHYGACQKAKARGGRARVTEIKVEEIYSGITFHGKLSNYKILRTEIEEV